MAVVGANLDRQRGWRQKHSFVDPWSDDPTPPPPKKAKRARRAYEHLGAPHARQERAGLTPRQSGSPRFGGGIGAPGFGARVADRLNERPKTVRRGQPVAQLVRIENAAVRTRKVVVGTVKARTRALF